MKTKLSELSMSQYIDLVCGDLEVLSAGDGIKTKREKVRRDIMLEYQSITDSGGIRRYLNAGMRVARAKTLCAIFAISGLDYRLADGEYST